MEDDAGSEDYNIRGIDRTQVWFSVRESIKNFPDETAEWYQIPSSPGNSGPGCSQIPDVWS